MNWLLVGLVLFIFQIATILVLEFRRPAKAVAWLMVLFIFPFIGFVAYYFMAQEYSHRRKVRRKDRRVLGELRRDLMRRARVARESHELPNPELHQEDRLFTLLHNIPSSPITRCNDVEVLSTAQRTYDSILEAMSRAERHIHVEYYILRSDETGRRFRNKMIEKAREGVEVRLIVDGVGSYELDGRFVRELREAGVQVYVFLPPLLAFFDKRANYRNHRKIVVVDGRTGFLGGVNVGNEYLGKDPKLGEWRDTHLRLDGDAVYFLQHVFLTDWGFVSGERLASSRYFPEHDCMGSKHVQVIPSGPDTQWDSILEVYLGTFAAAKRRIYIATPYFIPDPGVEMALKTAAISGIDVRIILPGVNDSKVVYWASLSYVQELLQVGVRFYRYRRGFMHAKVLLIDSMLASVGTANLDMRSFFSNFEINAVLFDAETLAKLERDFQRDLLDSEEIVLEAFERRPRTQRAKEVLARLLSPLF